MEKIKKLSVLINTNDSILRDRKKRLMDLDWIY